MRRIFKDADPTIITYGTLVQLVAEEAGYTLKDTRILLKALKTVIKRAVKIRRPISYDGLFTLSYTNIPAYRAWDGVRNKYFDRAATFRVKFTGSRKLVNSIEEDPVDEFLESLKE
jgi:hypothetical protein